MTREEFQKTPEGKKFLDIQDSAAFRLALDVTMLQFVETTAPCTDAQVAIANGYRMEGARRALQIISSIGTAKTLPTSRPLGNLDHKQQT